MSQLPISLEDMSFITQDAIVNDNTEVAQEGLWNIIKRIGSYGKKLLPVKTEEVLKYSKGMAVIETKTRFSFKKALLLCAAVAAGCSLVSWLLKIVHKKPEGEHVDLTPVRKQINTISEIDPTIAQRANELQGIDSDRSGSPSDKPVAFSIDDEQPVTWTGKDVEMFQQQSQQVAQSVKQSGMDRALINSDQAAAHATNNVGNTAAYAGKLVLRIVTFVGWIVARIVLWGMKQIIKVCRWFNGGGQKRLDHGDMTMKQASDSTDRDYQVKDYSAPKDDDINV